MITAKIMDNELLKIVTKPDNSVIYKVQEEEYYLGRGTYDKKYIGGDLKPELSYYFTFKVKITDDIITIFEEEAYLIAFDQDGCILDKVKYVPEYFDLKYIRDLKEIYYWQLFAGLDTNSVEGRKVLLKNFFNDLSLIPEVLKLPTKKSDLTFCFSDGPVQNEFVPLDSVVGLTNLSYAGRSWIDVFCNLNRGNNIPEAFIKSNYYDKLEIGEVEPKNIEFKKIDNEYYVESGAHRVTIAKLKVMKTIYAPVSHYKTSTFHKEYYNKLTNLGFEVNLCGEDHTYYNILTECDYKYDWEVFEVSLSNESILLFNKEMIHDFYYNFINLDISDRAIKFREYFKKFKKVYNILFSKRYSDSDQEWYDSYVTNAIENFFNKNNKLISDHKKKLGEKDAHK